VPTELSRLGAALVRHLVAYGDLAADEAQLAFRVLSRRVLGLGLAVAAGALSTLLACAWVIGLTWDGPYRIRTIAGMWCVFTGLAVLLWFGNRRGARPKTSNPFAHLRAEWETDKMILAAQFGRYAEDATHDRR
jgi:uncharacterized membrane protein YqjE